MSNKQKKNRQGEGGGRPLIIKTPEEMRKKIDAWFKECAKESRPLTMSGLALVLEMSRKSLVNYGKRDKFLHTIKKARRICEAYSEECLYTHKTIAGIIFSLKNNYGWKDKREHDITTQGEKITGFNYVEPKKKE